MRKTLGAVAVAAAVAGVGGVAVTAATQTNSHGDFGGFGGFGDFGGGPPGPPPGGPRAQHEPGTLHGEYVVAGDHGGFSTIVEQTGTITAISPISVTARSADGFSQTYVREAPGAGTPTFVAGDTVVITATREGEAAMVSTMGPPPSPGR